MLQNSAKTRGALVKEVGGVHGEGGIGMQRGQRMGRSGPGKDWI